MSKRTVFTTVTPLPASITRETVMDTLRSAEEMIDLNPLVEERHPIKPPPTATAEEFHCQWYSITDRVQYLPGGMMSGKVTYNACFHDLENGVQTHIYAPLGLNIRGKWTLGGSLPGEPIAPVELGHGTPLTGLWLREDVDMKCNFMMTSFVKGTTKKAHGTLVDRLLVKAQIIEASLENQKISEYAHPKSGMVDYSPASQYSQKSFQESQNPSLYQPNTSQAYSSGSRHESSHMQDEKYAESSLHPKPLSIRSSTSTAGGSQAGRSSYQDGPSTTPKVSWQNLNVGGRGTPVQNSANPYRTSPPNNHNSADYHYQHQRQESYQRKQQGGPLPPLPNNTPPPQKQTFELE